ncbi:hypothetical protein [Lentzea sp. NPDC003310]|uniref:hypothetical protein n=1 Tax=Lentzea sp. NPDC003310 TaxID=3154447 RepID=UPI0033B09F3F
MSDHEVAGWELTRHEDQETYRKRLANGITVRACWDGTGTVDAYVEPVGIGRTITSSRMEFRDKEAFFTAARLVVDMAANLPSFRMGALTRADHVLTSEVAGSVHAMPGSGAVPEAALTFTLTDGRAITLVLDENQADDLTSSIYSLSKHVWSEQREEVRRAPVAEAEVPDVSEVDAGPDTAHELFAVLERKFGVTEDFLLALTDWSAVVVVGEPAVSTLLDRVDELSAAIAPRWFPGATERPGEVWVVLYRAR